MAQLITVRLNKSDHQPLGFRLQGGKDFGTPLVVQKVNGGSAAERAGLQAGDALIRVNSSEVFALRHQEAQDTIRAAGTALELTVQRGGSTWRPSVTPTGSLPRPGSRPLGAAPSPVTNTSLKATPQPSRAFGSGHNTVAKPFGYMNGTDSVKSVVNKQYNTPVNMYSDKTIAETLSAQTEVLAGGVLGVNFKKNEKTYDAEKSAVFKVLQEEQNDPEPVEVTSPAPAPAAVSGLRHVSAPVTRPDAPLNTGGLPPGQNICEECERLITGVFVRIKDKNLHVECFKCATCGTSLKNQGYYNINGKLYCDIHAKLVARQNPPSANLEPVTVPPGGRIPSNTYSTPLPPLATNNYTNGSTSLFSPSSNLSGPKPFGSSIGSTYSPASLSPRSAPLSPARPVAAPAPAPAPLLSAPAPFAPTQNVKSIVWPPPVQPDDEFNKNICGITNLNTTTSENKTESELRRMSKTNPGPTQVLIAGIKTKDEKISCCQQTEQLSSTVSYSSANISALATTSSKSESVVQNAVTQVVNESISCAHKTVSEQRSSDNKQITIHQNSNENLFDRTGVQETIEIGQLQASELGSMKLADGMAKQQSIIQDKAKVEEQNFCKEVSRALVETADNASTIANQTQKFIEDNKSLTPSIQSTVTHNNTAFFKETSEHRDEMLTTNVSLINSLPQTYMVNNNTLVDALTTASERPYSPLPSPSQPTSLMTQNKTLVEETQIIENKQNDIKLHNTAPNTPSSKCFTSPPQRGITPIAPIKIYNPPENKQEPIPMPPETTPYIPPDFKINIEPKIPRETTSSPMVEALTTAPERPFTPIKTPTIERGSLRDALTIAPDRSYSPLPNIPQQPGGSAAKVQTSASEILRPIATQTSSHTNNQFSSDFSNLQNTCELQTSYGASAFKPVAKQMFPPPQPEDFCKLANFPPITEELRSSFEKANHTKLESSLKSDSKSMQVCSVASSSDTQTFSSVKSAQSYFEQLEQKETFSATAIRSKSGLHKPDSIPPYQKHFEQLPSQRGITPEICNAPAVLQRPVTPTTQPPTKSREVSQERQQKTLFQTVSTTINQKVPDIKPSSQQNHNQFLKDTPITMTFQPVTDEHLLRASPVRSRPSTPSLINKPAPIIPHYQMNLVAVEHYAPESHMFEPSSPETSRSPTPKLRSRSPAPGPPPNPLKAQAPRIRETTPQRHGAHTLLTQATSNLRKEHELANKGFQSNVQVLNTSGLRSWATDQPSIIKEQQQQHSSLDYSREQYNKDDVNIKQDSLSNLNYGQREVHSQNVSEYGNTTVHTTRKTFEEFEEKQSAKFIEIRKGGLASSGFQQLEPNLLSSNNTTKIVFPPPAMGITNSQVPCASFNETNDKVGAACKKIETYQPNPSTSGANQGPVCDPTPSTGSSVGAAARGKTFGVSSAPKRGRGVLNKAALPGSRVPLCASCNGNIRGPFITALGRIWCPEHFICVNATCRRPLQDIGFVEENGQLYCEFCFEQYIAPACDKCHAKIKGDCLNAIGKHYHPECFNCVYCGKLFGNNPFFLEDGLPYCEADWNELFTTKCFACGFPVEAGDRWVEALNNNYHSQCFNCTVCKKNLEGQSFFAKGGRPFCKTHAR